MRRRELLAIAGITLASRRFAESKPAAVGRVFNVRDYGAAGDGKTKDTEAIGRAVDECAKAGGGTVYLPPGTYLSGTVVLKENVTFELGCGEVCPPVNVVSESHAHVGSITRLKEGLLWYRLPACSINFCNSFPERNLLRWLTSIRPSATPKASPAGHSSWPWNCVKWPTRIRCARSATAWLAVKANWCISASPTHPTNPPCPMPMNTARRRSSKTCSTPR